MWLLPFLACKEPAAEFPAGLEPLEENLAPAPEGDHPETLSLVSGDDGDLHWTHGRAWVQAPAEAVIAAIQDPEVGVDRRRVASWEAEFDTEPEYEVSYTVHTVVEDIVTVSYDLAWRHGASGETTWGTRWQKTEGDALISLIEGSIEATEAEPEVVGLAFVYHLEATLTSTEDTEAFVSDFYASILAASHGEALPVWE